MHTFYNPEMWYFIDKSEDAESGWTDRSTFKGKFRNDLEQVFVFLAEFKSERLIKL